jgi:class 3 adenylate cyclase/CheY-like chemotaxis protein
LGVRVLLVQPDSHSAQELARLFSERGDTFWQAIDFGGACKMIDQVHPELVVMDLHLPGNSWLDLLRLLHTQYPGIKILLTNKYPDLQRELRARVFGGRIILREPFAPIWMEKAIAQLKDEKASTGTALLVPGTALPKVRIPMRLKITLPYVLLALFFALAGAYMVSQTVQENIQERFNNQLAATGKQSSDWMVRQENSQLETLRLVANISGIGDAILNSDSERLHQLVLPVAVNSGEEAVDILDANGISLLALHHASGSTPQDYVATRGEDLYKNWDFVAPVLQRVVEQGQDKFSGVAQTPWGSYFYISGPVKTRDGAFAGVVLVGKSLTSIVKEMHAETLAETTLYDMQGNSLASSLPTGHAPSEAIPPDKLKVLLSDKSAVSLVRDFTVASLSYREIVGPWIVRGNIQAGLLGAAMPRIYLVRTSQGTALQVVGLVVGALLLVFFVGITLAGQITRPLLKVVAAAEEIARGNLDVKVDTRGNDEVSILAHSFNHMVAGLQEGSMYRDLLGRTVSPEVREQLRQTFVSGNLRLEGQQAVGTVLMTDIRGFTTLSERADPATIFKWLNEYFAELVPIITQHSGVVNKFDGDAMLAFFGILPRLLNPKQSAYEACMAAVLMLDVIDRLNVQRVERGDPPLATGIGVNTGVIISGGLGTSDRLHYTIIGDTVNTAQRVEGLTRELLKVSGILISHATYTALEEYRSQFTIEPLGAYSVKGKVDRLMVYRLLMPGGNNQARQEKI